MKQELSEQEIVEQLKRIEYPIKVDVVDSVMEKIGQSSQPVRRNTTLHLWKYMGGVAACLAVALVINITIMFTKDYDEPSIGNMLAEVYYDQYSVESMATETLDEAMTLENYLYSEEY